MFIEPYSGQLEELHVDLLITPLFSDEKPPHDLSGFIDWRLGQQLSHWMIKGHLTGELGEIMFFPLNDFPIARRLLCYGLGPRKDYTGLRFEKVLQEVFRRIDSLRSVDVAMRVRLPKDLSQKEWQSRLWHDLQKQNPKEDVFVRMIDAELITRILPRGPQVDEDLKRELSS